MAPSQVRWRQRTGGQQRPFWFAVADENSSDAISSLCVCNPQHTEIIITEEEKKKTGRSIKERGRKKPSKWNKQISHQLNAPKRTITTSKNRETALRDKNKEEKRPTVSGWWLPCCTFNIFLFLSLLFFCCCLDSLWRLVSLAAEITQRIVAVRQRCCDVVWRFIWTNSKFPAHLIQLATFKFHSV